VRRRELALLDPVAGPAPVGDLKPWEDGLAARAGALRQVERAVADDLAKGSAAWRAGKERRLRSWLLLAGAVLVATLAAAAAALRVRDGGRDPALAAAGTVLGLARRGQALADRQLQLLEGLTRDEPDPQRRRDLLGADNLAGRLRRTAETMLAVASPGPVRERARPLPIDAVLRAATAEAEPGGAPTPAPGAGRRVDLLTTGDVEVAGPAAVDLVHLLAELLDNAAAFSSPTAPIVVTGAADGHGYLVEVTDRGLGMTDQELAWANQRLAGRGPGADPAAHAAGDRLGLVVVGRLARRNGFEVRLGRSPTGGGQRDRPGPRGRARAVAGGAGPAPLTAAPLRRPHASGPPRRRSCGYVAPPPPRTGRSKLSRRSSANSPIAAVLTQTIASRRLPLPSYVRLNDHAELADPHQASGRPAGAAAGPGRARPRRDPPQPG